MDFGKVLPISQIVEPEQDIGNDLLEIPVFDSRTVIKFVIPNSSIQHKAFHSIGGKFHGDFSCVLGKKIIERL